MKKLIGVCVIVAALAGTQAFGFGIPGFGGGDKKESGEKVDVQALTAREASLKKNVIQSAITLAKGLAEVEYAVGNEAMAAKLEAVAKEAEAKPNDLENVKENVLPLTNNAGKELKAMDLNAKVNKQEGQKRIGKSILYLGSASMVNLKAANDGQGLVTDITKGLNSVKSSPMSYGPTAVKQLTSGLNTAKFVAETMPGQVSTIAELSKGLVKYANTNKIALPSEKDKEKMAKEMEKE